MSNVLKPTTQRGQILFKENNNLQKAIEESYSLPSSYRQFVQAIVDVKSELAESHELIEKKFIVDDSHNTLTVEERWVKVK
jgi:hypothetical protein